MEIPYVPIVVGTQIVHKNHGHGVTLAAVHTSPDGVMVWKCWFYERGMKSCKSEALRVDIDSQGGFMYLTSWALGQGCREYNLFPPILRRRYMMASLCGHITDESKERLIGELLYVIGDGKSVENK